MDVFTPVGLDPPFHDPKRGKPERDLHSFGCYSRLKPGVNALQAEADLGAINARLAAQYPTTNQGYGISVNPILDVQVSDYAAMEIPIISGRDFNAADEYHEKKVAVINQATADRLFPGGNPLGKQIRDIYSRFGEPVHYYTIVGVVANSRHDSPDVPQADFQIYFPYTFARYGILLVRVSDSPAALLPSIRKLAASIDPDVPLSNMGVFEEQIANRFATRRLGVLLVGLFSGVALFLSAIGLYGLLAYSVRQQTREIGIRISLGAQTRNILELIVRRGFALVFAGLVVGVSVGLLLAPLIQSMLYEVSPADPVTLGLTVLVLGVAALIACLFPALRAVRINPVTALRE
jgi:ABC-type antimicrobial peptide transport system permease subunit